ncbi:hypothetical protein EUA98_04670 [Pengzhenrongella frigida]|uniref:Uncharacterized protein n=1 Tax=Pengzhenrongella frigida TaxID=1259133 RepID=A0A4Q5N2I2_9MICO|nr:hypothetical protein EUA98_04670 [Cellulomonas sp. HLT2-17]
MAWPMMSWPARATGRVIAWMANGWVMPSAASAATISGRMSKSAKDGLVAWTLLDAVLSGWMSVVVTLVPHVIASEDAARCLWLVDRDGSQTSRGAGLIAEVGRQPDVNIHCLGGQGTSRWAMRSRRPGNRCTPLCYPTGCGTGVTLVR